MFHCTKKLFLTLIGGSRASRLGSFQSFVNIHHDSLPQHDNLEHPLRLPKSIFLKSLSCFSSVFSHRFTYRHKQHRPGCSIRCGTISTVLSAASRSWARGVWTKWCATCTTCTRRSPSRLRSSSGCATRSSTYSTQSHYAYVRVSVFCSLMLAQRESVREQKLLLIIIVNR